MKIRMEVLKGMRLYNTYYICKQCRDIIMQLEFRIKSTLSERVGVYPEYEIKNWKSYKEALFAIKQISILSHDVDEFYKIIPAFVREDKEPQIDRTAKERLVKIKICIVCKLDVIIELYEDINGLDNEHGIDVKIPPCESLRQYIYYLKEIDFIFSQYPYLQYAGGVIKYKAVDVGSQWLLFGIEAVAGTVAISYILRNLALLIDKAIQVKSHIINIEQQEEVLRSRKLQNDALESSLEGLNILKKYYYDEAIKAIEKENKDVPLKDGEERGKVEKCLEKLGKLMDKGVEIYASINTDKDIQVLFPALEDRAELPDSIIKYIEDKQKPKNE